MTRNAGTRRPSPRLLIALALVLGVAIGVAAFREPPAVERTLPGEVKSHVADPVTMAEEPAPLGSGAIAPGRAGPRTGLASMQVALDPETGEFGMPTATQRRQLSPELQRDLSYSDEGLQVEYRADGSRHVNLEGRFQSFSVARIREDGSVDYQCVQGQGEANRLLQQRPPTAGDALPEE